MKLRLKNFQSHKDSELDLAPFTVIVGHSSSGKSAIIRAIKTLLYNIPSKSFIKNGTKKLEIELTTDEDKILYTRDSSTAYTINDGNELKAVGRDQVPQIAEMGYAPLEIDKKKYYPQLSQQWDSPFLISFTDAEVSKILSTLSSAGKVKSAKSRIIKDMANSASTISIRQLDRENIQNKLLGLGDVEGQDRRLQGILESQLKATKAEQLVLRTEALNNEIASNCRIVIVSSIPEDPRSLIRLLETVESSTTIKVPNVPENPKRYIELLNTLENSKTFNVPDMSKIDAALKLITRLDCLKLDIDCIEFNILTDKESELKSLEDRIHELSEICSVCGQKLPEKENAKRNNA